MKFTALTSLFLWLAACGGTEVQEDASQADSVAAGSEDTAAVELPPMPDFPAAVAGRISLVSAGSVDLSNVAPVRAGICQVPGMLQVLGELPGSNPGESWAVLVLLALPDDAAERETIYPVTNVETGLPDPPASQIAVQVLSTEGGTAYQGLDGDVEVYAWGDLVSGRLQITVREINSQALVRLSGVFEQAPIQALPDEQCALVGPAGSV